MKRTRVPSGVAIMLVSRVLTVWQIKIQGNIRTNLQSSRMQSSCSQRGISQIICFINGLSCVLWILVFRLVIKCRCLIVCLVELIQQNMKDLGKVGRKRKQKLHWAMESKRDHDKLINGYGISEGKSNLATGSFCFWNEMDINDLKREVKFSTKGI